MLFKENTAEDGLLDDDDEEEHEKKKKATRKGCCNSSEKDGWDATYTDMKKRNGRRKGGDL